MVPASPPDSWASARPVTVFEEVLRLAGVHDSFASAVTALDKLSNNDLEELRSMRNPPAVVKRALEVTCLVLDAAKSRKTMSPPPWERVRRMLTDANFLTRIRAYNADALRISPALTSFIATEYFCANQQGTPQTRATISTDDVVVAVPSLGSRRRFMSTPAGPVTPRKTYAIYRERCKNARDPLTFQRVHQASKAAAALFRWCVATVVQATTTPELSPEAPTVPEPEKPPEHAKPVASREELAIAQETAEIELIAPVCANSITDSPPIRVIPIVTKPDRHFEALITFELGTCQLDEMEHTLQRVAATMCLRRSLRLELLSCPAYIEHEATAQKRLHACVDFFRKHGLSAQVSSERPRVARGDATPGVICQVSLDRDRELKDYFILTDGGEHMELSGHSRCVMEDLRDEFRTIMH